MSEEQNKLEKQVDPNSEGYTEQFRVEFIAMAIKHGLMLYGFFQNKLRRI